MPLAKQCLHFLEWDHLIIDRYESRSQLQNPRNKLQGHNYYNSFHVRRYILFKTSHMWSFLTDATGQAMLAHSRIESIDNR